MEPGEGGYRPSEAEMAMPQEQAPQEITAEAAVEVPEATAPQGDGPRGLNEGDTQERHPNVSEDIMPAGQITQENGKWYVGGWQVDKNGYYAQSLRGDSDATFARLKQSALMREHGVGIGLSKPVRTESVAPTEEADPNSTVQ